MMKPKTKTHGEVFTPPYLVNVILDYAGYRGAACVLRRHIIDNSCGDGAFLVEIARRYAAAFLSASDDREQLRDELGQCIHGIEIIAENHAVCLWRLDAVAREYGVEGVQWDVQCADALTVDDYNGRMDYVVGNPPYVRVHNLDCYESVKTFRFATEGMTDLYIVFFELGLRMLSPTGRMSIIAPSSWLASKAGRELRKHIVRHRQLSGVIDLGHFMPFNATTYTLIARLEGAATRVGGVDYNTYDGSMHHVAKLQISDMLIDGAFYLDTPERLQELRRVRETATVRRVEVKNGFATLADKVFIAPDLPSEGCVIDIIKASTGKWSKCLYPYDEQGRPLSLATIERQFAASYRYLLSNKGKLLKRDADQGRWYLFGRTQALKDVRRQKIAVNSLIRTGNDVKCSLVAPQQGVYGGLYILTRIPYDDICQALRSDHFTAYVAALKNYKSGGYYTFSSRDLELFLNYQFKDYHNEQPRVSEHHRPVI